MRFPLLSIYRKEGSIHSYDISVNKNDKLTDYDITKIIITLERMRSKLTEQ